MSTTPRILILSSAEDEESTAINNDFIAKLNEEIGEVGSITWHNYRDIRIEFGTNKLEVYIDSTGEPLINFKFVYFKSFFRNNEQAAVIASYLQTNDIPFVCSELRSYMPLTKLTQFARLAIGGLPIAQTIYLHNSHYIEKYDYIVEKLGLPFIFKSTDGSGGEENYLIKDKRQLTDALASHQDLHFVAQKFIENDSDLRVLIVNSQIALVIRRLRQGDSHLNNTSQGGSAALVPVKELPKSDQGLSLRAAVLMGRETAGVDLMYEIGTGNPYILEVNASPQIGSGAFMAEKVKIYGNYFKNMLK